MAVSIRDIALRAGVAPSTVSRVINGSENYRISRDTSNKVWKAIRALNYQVDPVARHIIRKRWHGDKTRGGMYRLAIVFPGMSNELAASFHHDILFGIQAAIIHNKLTVAGMYEARQLQEERALFHATDPNEVDGMLIVSGGSIELEKRISSRITNTVILNSGVLPKRDTATFDHHTAIGLMVRHMHSLGHRHIAYLGRSLEYKKASTSNSSQKRTHGYLDAMKELGLQADTSKIIDMTDARETAFESQFQSFVGMNPRPTAIVCASDRLCVEMMRRLTIHGLRVPHDVALGGFEDIEIASAMIPRLTTVHAPRQELGSEGVRLLIRRIQEPDAPFEHLQLPTHLVIRESCGANISSEKIIPQR